MKPTQADVDTAIAQQENADQQTKEIQRVGGPAFPQPCTSEGYAANSYYGQAGGGMSLRDYFAAHAPPEPANWFEPTGLIAIPFVPPGAKFCKGCQADEGCDKSASCKAMHEYDEAATKIRKSNKRRTFGQWRWAYADALLETENE